MIVTQQKYGEMGIDITVLIPTTKFSEYSVHLY